MRIPNKGAATGGGIQAGDGWSAASGGTLTLDAYSGAVDPSLALAGTALSTSGPGGFAAAEGLPPAVIDATLDAAALATGYALVVAIGIPTGDNASAWNVAGVARYGAIYRFVLPRDTSYNPVGFWRYIGGEGAPYPDLAEPPVRIRWDHAAGVIRYQLSDGSWSTYTYESGDFTAYAMGNAAPTAWGFGVLGFDALAASGGSVTLRRDGPDPVARSAWSWVDDAGELARVAVAPILSVLARRADGSGLSLPVSAVARRLLAALSESAMRSVLGLASVASSGSASDLSEGTVPTARLGSGTAGAMTFLRGDQSWRDPVITDQIPTDSAAWRPPYIGGATALTTAVATAGSLRAVRFVPPRDMTLAGLMVSLTVAGAAGTKARVAIYADDGTGRKPLDGGAALAESGDLDTASTGDKSATGLSYVMTQGVVYWVATHFSGTPTCRAVPLASLDASLGFTTTIGTAVRLGWSVAATYTVGAAAPAWPAGATALTAASPSPLLNFSN